MCDQNLFYIAIYYSSLISTQIEKKVINVLSIYIDLKIVLRYKGKKSNPPCKNWNLWKAKKKWSKNILLKFMLSNGLCHSHWIENSHWQWSASSSFYVLSLARSLKSIVRNRIEAKKDWSLEIGMCERNVQSGFECDTIVSAFLVRLRMFTFMYNKSKKKYIPAWQ